MNAVVNPNDRAANGLDPADRAATVLRLRRQVVSGTYVPPVELLVERLVSLLVEDRANRWAHPAR